LLQVIDFAALLDQIQIVILTDISIMQQTPSSVSSALSMMRSGIFSARELTEAFLNRIAETDCEIKAWVLVDAERARSEADAADQKMKMQIPLGPLHGIPIGVKDVIDVADWPTAAGSTRWRNAIAREDAPCVKSLRRAGAVLLGKTVTTPFASFDPAPTLNPRFPDRSPGGSSAGAAAAVAAGHCFASLGTQTGGSILRPASYCGVAGYKPTYGNISKQGVVPLAPSLDHVGVIAQNVSNLLEIAKCLSKFSGLLFDSKFIVMIDRKLNSTFVDSDFCDYFDQIISKTKFGKFRYVDVSLPSDFFEVIKHHHVIMASEAFEWHAERWYRFPDDYPPCISRLLAEGAGFNARDLLQAQRFKRSLKKTLMKWWPTGVFLIMPCTPSSPPDRSSTGDPRCQSPWSFLGWPTIGIPCTKTIRNEPFSVQIIGLPGSDKALFELGLCLETDLQS